MTLPLSGDEAYHWEWSRHLDWGYYDHPGMTGYVIFLSTALLGSDSELGVRFPAIVLGGLTALAAWSLAARVTAAEGAPPLVQTRAGFWAGTLLLITPLFAGLSCYMSTDPPLLCSWTLALLFFFRALTDGRWRDWIAGGLAYGMALQSKFLAFFLGIALGAFLLLSRQDRQWIRKPHPYVAGALALAVWAPFLWWNARHNWATFVFNFTLRQNRTFAPRYVAEFLACSFLVLSPGLFLSTVRALFRSLSKGLCMNRRVPLYLGLTSAFPLGYFLGESVRQSIGIHWPATAWISALVALASQWAQSGGTEQTRLPRKSRVTLVMACALTLGVHAAAHWPPEWIPEWAYALRPDRITTAKHVERFGWRELGVHLHNARLSMRTAQGRGQPQADSRGVALLADQYGLAAAVAFYTPGQPAVHLWRSPKTHGENYRYWDDFSALKHYDLILVSKKESRAQRAAEQLRQHCRHVTAPEPFPVYRKGTLIRYFYLVRGYDFDGRQPQWNP